jgi:hypothetical protein
MTNAAAKTQRIYSFQESDDVRLAKLEQRVEAVEREARDIAEMKTTLAIIKAQLETIVWLLKATLGAGSIALLAKLGSKALTLLGI